MLEEVMEEDVVEELKEAVDVVVVVVNKLFCRIVCSFSIFIISLRQSTDFDFSYSCASLCFSAFSQSACMPPMHAEYFAALSPSKNS